MIAPLVNYSYRNITNDQCLVDTQEIPSNSDVDQYYQQTIMPIVESGLTCSLFSYGGTASGKTITMFGDNQNGIIYKSAETLLNKHQNLKVSVMEIYEEQMTDLLSQEKWKLIKNIVPIDVNSMDGLNKLISTAIRNSQAKRNCTVLNARAGVSFIILTLQCNDQILRFIDMPGQQRIFEQPNKETIWINSSLQYFKLLLTNLSKKAHLNYNDSLFNKYLKSINCFTNKVHFIMHFNPKYAKDNSETYRLQSVIETI